MSINSLEPIAPPSATTHALPDEVDATDWQSSPVNAPATSTVSPNIPVLDSWRGIAVTLLLLGHFCPLRYVECGSLGVEFFFVLSGFLMGRILFVRQTPLTRFYSARIARIFPAAYLYLSCVVGYIWYSTSGTEPGLAALASTSLFYMNYLAGSGPTEELQRLAGHFWSLCVEEHTYIVLSAFALLHRRRGVSPLLSIGL